MAFTVSKTSQSLVIPDEPTPTTTLSLSFLDTHPAHYYLAQLLQVFDHGGEAAAAVLRRALSKALVLFYPLAGRLVVSSSGELQVVCTGEGVWFVEAYANCTLEDVNYLDHPRLIADDHLLPYPPHDKNPLNLPVLMQVTAFTCGGFTVSFVANHAITDGLGVSKFLRTIAEIAKGLLLENPSIKPVWSRDAIPSFPKPLQQLQASPVPTAINFHLEYFVKDIPFSYINQQKKHFSNQTGLACSTFDVVVAKAWQCRTRAIKLEPDTNVHLLFPVDISQWLSEPLDVGFYGNRVYLANVTASSGIVANGSLVEVMSLIRSSKERMGSEFCMWAEGDDSKDPFPLSSMYSSIVVPDWRPEWFFEVDYGWGAPNRIGPLTLGDHICMCMLLRSPVTEKGMRIITHCVSKEHLDGFQALMTDLA